MPSMSATSVRIVRRLAVSIIFLMACVLARLAVAQPQGGQPPAAAPSPETPNPPPAAAKEVVDAFVNLLTAKPLDVESLKVRAAEIPACRLRLYVAPPITDQTLVGIDYRLYRNSGQVHGIALQGISPTFRERLNRLLADPVAVSTKAEEAGVRILDIWCQRIDPGTTFMPVFAKVWSNSLAGDIPNNDSATPVLGRVCYDDKPAIAECQQAFDFSPPIFKSDMTELSAPASTVSALAEALTAHRSALAAFVVKQAASTPTTRRRPGGAMIGVDSTHALNEESCSVEGTMFRLLAGGESFFGLKPDAKTGTVTLRLKSPFPIGGGVLRLPARITTPKASIDVEVSKDGTGWTPLYLLDPASGRRTSASWQAAPAYPLPKSLFGSTKLQIRARLASTEEAQTPEQSSSRAMGPRFLDIVSRIPRTTEIQVDDGLLRATPCNDPVAAPEKPLQVVVQPERIDAESVSAMVQAGEAEVELYSPCDVDESSCAAIGKYPGTVRFWAASTWQEQPPAWLNTIGTGEGRLEFPGLQSPAEALAKAVVSGKKSVSFSLADRPSAALLTVLATCTGTLALDGIRHLDSEQAAALNAFQGTALSLSGLRTVALAAPPAPLVAAALVASPGTCTFSGTEPLVADLAGILVGGEKHLVVDGQKSLDPQLAAVLAASPNGVFLDGVTDLAPEAAEPLLGYAGPYLSLKRLQRVECGVEALASPDRRAKPRLRDVVRHATGDGGAADPQKQAADAEKEKELEAVLRQAEARKLASANQKAHFVELSKTSGMSLAALVDRLRELVQILPAEGGQLDPGAGRPVRALLEAPGIFVLRPPTGRPDRRSRLDKTTFEMLAKGRKDLDLGCLTSIDDVESAAALAAADNAISLDGLTSLSPEIAAALAKYSGPFLSLNGVQLTEAEAKAILPLFEPLVRDDRASLASIGMMNLDGLRDFATQSVDSLPDKQKKLAKQFVSGSGSRDWTGAAAGQRLKKGKPSIALGDSVVFEGVSGPVTVDAGGKQTDKIPATMFSSTSIKTLKSTLDLGKELALLRTKARFQAAGSADGGVEGVKP